MQVTPDLIVGILRGNASLLAQIPDQIFSKLASCNLVRYLRGVLLQMLERDATEESVVAYLSLQHCTNFLFSSTAYYYVLYSTLLHFPLLELIVSVYDGTCMLYYFFFNH
jgi:hypothetical protein